MAPLVAKPSARQVLRSRKNVHALLSSTATLVLGIMGSAVLIISAAFAETGIIAGFLLLFVVAIVNAYTSDLLIRQCRITGTTDYDTLTYAVGGPIWRFISQFGIVILLLGTLAGGVSQIGQAFSYGLEQVSNPPGWLVNGTGRMLMVFCVIFLVIPLCLPNNLTSLDYAGVLGFVLVLFLTGWITVKCIIEGFPAINNGFAIGGFGTLDGITSAISSLGFAFYIQPIMLPMLIEMPNGHDGSRILSWAVNFTIMVAALVTYAFIGFFGAAWFGQDTEGNILQNDLGKAQVQAFLNISIAIYLAISLPPVVFPVRQVLDAWLPGPVDKHPFLRKCFLIAVITIIYMLVGLLAPDSSAETLVVTGATGVLIVSYIVPIVNHFCLYFGWARCQRRYMQKDPFWDVPLDNFDDSVAGFVGRPPPGARKVLTKPSVPHGTMAVSPEYHVQDTANGMSDVDLKAAETMEHGDDIVPSLEPLDKMVYRVKYKSKFLEWTFELLWPILVLGVGLFASISALTYV